MTTMTDIEMTEEMLVRQWRIEQFEGLGFCSEEASALADSGADLGQARRLRRQGCLTELAFRILL